MPKAVCEHPGCSKTPSFGMAWSKKREFCSEHAKDGMVDLNHKKCAHQDCTKRPSFGVAGTKKPEFCTEHAKEGMFNLRNKKCVHPGCSKIPSFGVAGTKKREFCREHAKGGMIDLAHKKCDHQSCTKQPSFGVAGTKKPEFCREHAKEGMFDLRNKKCVHPGCSKQTSFGVAGTKKREFCREHAKEGMFDLRNKKCVHSGCSKQPSFGVAGTKKREFCREHATEMVARVAGTAGGDRGGAHGRGASRVPQARSGGLGGSRRKTPHRARPREKDNDLLSVPSEPGSSGPAVGRRRVGRVNDSSIDAAGQLCPTDPGVQEVYDDAGIFTEKIRSLSRLEPQRENNDRGTAAAAAVKAEGVVLSSNVVARDGRAEEEGAAAARLGRNDRNKRKGRAPGSPAAHANAGASSSGKRSINSSSSSSRGHGKRARRAVDDNVVVLEPDVDRAVAAASTGGVRSLRAGPQVAVKPEL